MSTIHFSAKLSKINSWTILKLPKDASSKLSSRGMVMVKGSFNGSPFETPLEPDGQGSHWFRVDEAMLKGAKTKLSDTVTLDIETSKEWPEPKLPADLKSELSSTPKVNSLWTKITPMARWDWLRWISATKDLGTRKHRIEVAFSKLNNGSRRPCCFNRTMCTVPEVSKGGVLLKPAM